MEDKWKHVREWKPSWLFPRLMYELSRIQIGPWYADVMLFYAFIVGLPILGLATNTFMICTGIILCASMWAVFGSMIFNEYGNSSVLLGVAVMCYSMALFSIQLILKHFCGIQI